MFWALFLAFLHTKSAISFNILSVQMICLWYGAIYMALYIYSEERQGLFVTTTLNRLALQT